MGSMVEINDTLQLTREQGFPSELDLDRHLEKPIKLDDLRSVLFSFIGKNAIRNYQQAPTRCLLAENRNGKWIYWGLIHVLEVTHDYVLQTTSGKYKLAYIYTPEEMKIVHHLIDQRPEADFFK